MPLITYPVSIPIEERRHPHDCLSMFVNCGNERSVERWANEQVFNVYEYKGWHRTYFFDETSHYILLMLEVPQRGYLLNKPHNEKFMPFYETWRKGYDERQEAYKAKIRAERIARGEKVD